MGGSSYGGTYIIVGKGILSFGVVFFFGGCPYLWGWSFIVAGVGHFQEDRIFLVTHLFLGCSNFNIT